MRRWLGPVLLGIGVFLLVTAGMMRFYVADRLVVTPIDQYVQTTAVGPGRWLDGATGQEQTGDLTAIRTVKGDVPASSEDVAVWDVSVVVQTGTGTMVRTTLDRVAIDRRTAEAVQCCGESSDGEPTRHSGVTYKFPFGTEKRDYTWWEPNSRQAYPAKYVAEEKVQGLTTYKFIQQVPGQELVRSGATVWFQDARTIWVEPRSGVIVKGNEQLSSTLGDSSGPTIIQFDVAFDDATQKSLAKLARDAISSIQAVTLWIPLLGLILGLILLAAGFVLLRADRGGRTPVQQDEPPVPVGGGADSS
jgi:hypothetical protein